MLRPQDGFDVADGVFHRGVDNDIVIILRLGQFVTRDLNPGAKEFSSDSLSLPFRRCSASAMLGGTKNMRMALGIRALTWRAPWTSISSITSNPSSSHCSTLSRGVP